MILLDYLNRACGFSRTLLKHHEISEVIKQYDPGFTLFDVKATLLEVSAEAFVVVSENAVLPGYALGRS